MAKISELLSGRDKLEKYDELVKWKDIFNGNETIELEYVYEDESIEIPWGARLFEVPAHIKEIIVSALDAEIKKLDDE